MSWCGGGATGHLSLITRRLVLLGAEGGDGIDASGAAGGKPAGDEGNGDEQERHCGEGERVLDWHFSGEARNETHKAGGAEETDHRAEERQLQTGAQNKPHDVARLRAERDAEADFGRALG